MGKKNQPGCPCCGVSPCVITVHFRPTDCGPATGVPTITVKTLAGATVGTGYDPTWTGPAGSYSVTYDFPAPYSFSVTKTYHFGCGSSTVIEPFILHVTLSLSKTVCSAGPPPNCTTACLDGTESLSWKVGGSPLGGTDSGPGCTHTLTLGVYLDPSLFSTVTCVVTYHGGTLTATPATTCGLSAPPFQVCTAGYVLGCNGGGLPGATVTGPDGETATTDGDGIFVLTYTTPHATPPALTFSKTRFVSQTVTGFVCGGSVQLEPDAGYACAICCVDPLKTTLYGTTTASSTTHVGNITYTYDPVSMRWLGCETFTGQTVHQPGHVCTFVWLTTGDTPLGYSFGVSPGAVDCRILIDGPSCFISGGGGSCYPEQGSCPFDPVFGSGTKALSTSGTITCPDVGFSATYHWSHVLSTSPGCGATFFYNGISVDHVITE